MRPFGRLRHSWVDNIKTDFEGIGLRLWTAFVWQRTGTRGGLLCTR